MANNMMKRMRMATMTGGRRGQHILCLWLSILFSCLLVSLAQDEQSSTTTTEVPTPRPSPAPTVRPTLFPTVSPQPSSRPTVSPGPTYTGFPCTLCQDEGVDIAFPDKELYMYKTGEFTCQSIDGFMARAQSVEDCSDRLISLEEFPVDVQSFCGCSNAQQPNYCPDLCDEGTSVRFPDLDVTIFTYSMTCEQVTELNLFAKDTNWCAQIDLLGKSRCCYDANAVIVQPTSAPTRSGYGGFSGGPAKDGLLPTIYLAANPPGGASEGEVGEHSSASSSSSLFQDVRDGSVAWFLLRKSSNCLGFAVLMGALPWL